MESSSKETDDSVTGGDSKFATQCQQQSETSFTGDGEDDPEMEMEMEASDEEMPIDEASGGSENEADSNEEDEAEVTSQTSKRKHASQDQRAHKDKFTSDFVDFSFTHTSTGTSEETILDTVVEPEESHETETDAWLSKDTVSTVAINTKRRFLCVKFPAIVRNKEKALTCLGGHGNIVQVEENKKIDLRFRPDDPFCKPVHGAYKKNNHVLLRCLRRKVSDAPSLSTSDTIEDGYEYKIEVVGVVNGIISFKRPCDFQYLCMEKQSNGQGYRNLLQDVVIQEDDDRDRYLGRDVPLFLPPFIFYRSERPVNYQFQNESTNEDNTLGRHNRKMRTLGTQVVQFFSKNEVPQGPNADAQDRYTSSKVAPASLEPLKKLFEERPLWSKTAVINRMKAIGRFRLAAWLNMVAYHFTTGPWNNLWCRFGFDPRKSPEAKMYQCVNFRIRTTQLREMTDAKRGKDMFTGALRTYNTIKGHALPASMTHLNLGADGSGPSTSAQSDLTPKDFDPLYQYVPERLPPYRQMLYQICDIFEDTVQKMAHQNDGQEEECTEKDGFCIPDFVNKTRDILADHMEKLMEK